MSRDLFSLRACNKSWVAFVQMYPILVEVDWSVDSLRSHPRVWQSSRSLILGLTLGVIKLSQLAGWRYYSIFSSNVPLLSLLSQRFSMTFVSFSEILASIFSVSLTVYDLVEQGIFFFVAILDFLALVWFQKLVSIWLQNHWANHENHYWSCDLVWQSVLVWWLVFPLSRGVIHSWLSSFCSLKWAEPLAFSLDTVKLLLPVTIPSKLSSMEISTSLRRLSSKVFCAINLSCSWRRKFHNLMLWKQYSKWML